MDGYLLFNFDDTISTVAFDYLKAEDVPEGMYIYCLKSTTWFIRKDTEYSWWHDKQPEDVPKQHRAALLIYS